MLDSVARWCSFADQASVNQWSESVSNCTAWISKCHWTLVEAAREKRDYFWLPARV